MFRQINEKKKKDRRYEKFTIINMLGKFERAFSKMFRIF